jgi:hypothetical protein
MFLQKFFVVAAFLTLAACTPGGQSASFTPPSMQTQSHFIADNNKPHLLIR